MTKYFNVLLIFAPVAILGEFLHWSPVIVFWSAAVAVIPCPARRYLRRRPCYVRQ